jgi:hypothetical protein
MADSPTSESYAAEQFERHQQQARYLGPAFLISPELEPHVINMLRVAFSAGRFYALCDAKAIVRGTTPPKPAAEFVEKYPEPRERFHDYTRDRDTGIPVRGEI